jgi:hypothetical protein|nr:MAG TPA: hypothetical protein [Caudoviricetes sp.]
MNLLFRTYSLFPLALVKNKTLNIGDIVQIGENKYYINCAPNTISPTGKKYKFYYCIQATNNCEVTNTI